MAADPTELGTRLPDAHVTTLPGDHVGALLSIELVELVVRIAVTGAG